jgi:hypothetical protein
MEVAGLLTQSERREIACPIVEFHVNGIGPRRVGVDDIRPRAA